MKKIQLLLAGVVLCLTNINSGAQVSADIGVIGRIDANPTFYFTKGMHPDFCFGNSVFYTDVEASFGENVKMTWVGHWLETGAAELPFMTQDPDYYYTTPDLYKSTWRSDSNTWTDFFYFDFLAGNWAFRLGKDVVAIGGFEYDAWDWDCTYSMTSLYWQCNAAYQWGASVNWMTPSEMSDFTVQAVSTPYTERPWQHGMGSYAFKYHGEYGPIETCNAFNFVQSDPEDKGRGVGYLTLGLRGNISDQLSISAEWTNRWDSRNALKQNFFKQSSKSLLSVLYSPTPKLSFDIKGGFERIGIEQELGSYVEFEEGEAPVSTNYGFGGLTVSYSLLRNSDDLHLLGTIASNNFIKGLDVSIGIIYNHNFHVGK